MYKVSGKVLVKETGLGIPDLLIVLYDQDNLQASQGPPPEIFSVPNQPLPFYWQSFPGERLGSVLTDESGRFELTFEEAEFEQREPIKRPDLVLLVMAPEDTQQQPGTFNVPRPSAQRILHYSYDPVVNSGKKEGYIIRIPSRLLDDFGILYPGQSRVSSTTPQLISSLEQARQLETAIRQNEQIYVRNNVTKQRELTTKAKGFVAELSATPLQFRRSPLFVGDAKAPDATTRITTALTQARNEGLKKLDAYKTRVSPTLRIYLTDDKLADLRRRGLVRPDGTNFLVDSVCSLLSSHISGVTLQRVQSLLKQQRDNPSTPPGGNSSNGNGANPPAVDLPPAEQIRQRVLGQIQHLETPNLEQESKGVMNNLLDMLQEIKSAAQGPSDVAALRDFHSLQIAFPQVWTEAFDRRLRDSAERLYRETVRLHEEYGLSFPPLEAIREVNQFRQFLSQTKEDFSYVAVTPIPPDVAVCFPESELDFATWNSLSLLQQQSLQTLAQAIKAFREDAATREIAENLRKRGQQIIAKPAGNLGRAQQLILEMGEMLAEPYAFHYFAPNSINFGLLVTYRQEWVPETYQVGDLVATIPLAPNETRKFTTKRVVKTSRSQKEIEKSLSSRQEEFQQTSRAEDEILHRSQISTNFQMTAEGSLNFGIGQIGGSTQFALNQAQESSRTKKSFHEAVMKAAYEYKSERSLEIETTSEQELEFTTSGELSNPNNELTVTYLLYELERRYKITEKLHRLTPVILVAQDIPAPHEIDEDWLLAHEWILRRVLLDDSLKMALDYLSDEFVGNEVSLEIKQASWQVQRNLVEKLENQVASFLTTRDGLRETLANLTERAEIASAGEPDDIQRGFVNMLTGGFSEIAGAFGGATDSEKLEAARKVAEMRLDYLKESLSDAQSKLSRAAEALNQATSQYTRALEEQSNKRTAIDQLRVHVKQNILYYMQAIWDHEPPDQRFFRLYHQEVELPAPATQVCRMRLATPEEIDRGVPGIRREGSQYILDCAAPVAPSPERRTTKTLVEIADLDNPLGYKGNYMIFPLKECTYLTDFMMQEYIDDYFGIRDPDEAGNFTTDELLKYAEQKRDELSVEERRALDQMIAERLTNPRRDSETIIVPTGQLFIEALTGAHSLLEPFKMLHRGLDVAKVEAEVREMNLENLRRAARLIEGDREDPEIDKKIVFQGNNSSVIVPPEA
jgi:hypothetical protein